MDRDDQPETERDVPEELTEEQLRTVTGGDGDVLQQEERSRGNG